MAVLQDININVFAQPSEKRLRSFLVLSQNENGRTINFRILGSPLPSSCTATLSGTKPDGNVYSTSGIVAGNFVIVQEDIQMTAVAGVWDAKLDIVNGSHNIMTAIIRITVEGDVVAPGSVPSNSQLDGYIAQAKFYAEESRVEAYGSPLTAATKSAMIDKNRVYVYTGSESNMTAGNWYYWNGTAWVSGGVYNSAAVDTDTTLTLPDKAADAKAVGDAFSSVREDLNIISADLVNLSNGKQTISGVFSYGVFNSSNMPETDPRKFNAVMMTAETYGRDITLTAKGGYNFLAYFYDANDNYVGKSARWETSKYVPKNTYFRLWVRPDPLDTSIVLNLDTVKQQILFNVPIQDEIDDTVKSVALANANAELSGAGLQMIDTSFAYGTMNTQTGQAVLDTSYKYQVIMPTYVTYDRDVTIKCNSGYRYQVWWYNEDDTYISRTASFRTDADEYTITAGTHFRLFVTLNPPNISANVPIETFAENIFIRTKINDRVTAVETKPLSTLPEYILNTLSYKQVGVLSKGYILLSCDDGTEGLATYTIPMLINKGVPATFGLLMTSPVITNESYLSTVIDAVNNHGCCVAQHGSAQWTTYTEDALNKYFDDTEALFTEKGIIEIHGAICPGGAVADTNALVQAVAGGRFKSLFSGGSQGEIKYGNYNAVGARTNMYAMARYSAIGFTQQTYQQAIDDAYDNHYILCPFWHDYSVVDDTAKQAIIEGMIDYAKTKGLTFITMADLPTII